MTDPVSARWLEIELNKVVFPLPARPMIPHFRGIDSVLSDKSTKFESFIFLPNPDPLNLTDIYLYFWIFSRTFAPQFGKGQID